jgi:mannose-6-phosphate isomerase-like protein (cupin superfamily)
MKGYVDDIEQATVGNDDFRRVLHTGTHLQLVLMALRPGEAIGEEMHEDRDQFFCVEAGEGEIVIDGSRHRIEDDFAALVPAGARYDVINTGAGTAMTSCIRTEPRSRPSTWTIRPQTSRQPACRRSRPLSRSQRLWRMASRALGE